MCDSESVAKLMQSANTAGYLEGRQSREEEIESLKREIKKLGCLVAYYRELWWLSENY
jgi:hypothetical protein